MTLTVLNVLISALDDLTMSSLAPTARLLVCQRPTLMVRMKISFISFFFLFWVEGLLVSGCCHSLYVTLSILHVAHAFQGLAKQFFYFPFVGCSQGFRLRDLWIIPFLPFAKGFTYSEIYDGWCRTAGN